jgi:hypothetical protein
MTDDDVLFDEDGNVAEIGNDLEWAEHFRIESKVDLDFVIGQMRGYPVGMQKQSPAAFKRRILAAKLSYEMRLSSIDYTLKRYVDSDVYEREEIYLGEIVSSYLRVSCNALSEELGKLHTQGELPFGIFGAELTLFRFPHLLDTARMMANRGLLLEVLPMLRLGLEMTAWAHTAFFLTGEEDVINLKAQSCISHLKRTYGSVGRLYGLLSEFTHWGHAIHGEFIDIDDEEKVAIVNGSVRYRATSLAACLTLLDVFVAVTQSIYGERSALLARRIQGAGYPQERHTYEHLTKIAKMTRLRIVSELQSIVDPMDGK